MSKLPEQFSDLERFVDRWALADYDARYETRLHSSMHEMEEFYGAVMPRYGEIMAYLNGFELNNLSEQQTNLLHIMYSLVQVSFPVEVWKQPSVPDAGAAYLEAFNMPVV